jgi:hypothetical protein
MNTDERYERFMSRLGWATLFTVLIGVSMPVMSLGRSWLVQNWQPINRELVPPSPAEKERGCIYVSLRSQEKQMAR